MMTLASFYRDDYCLTSKLESDLGWCKLVPSVADLTARLLLRCWRVNGVDVQDITKLSLFRSFRSETLLSDQKHCFQLKNTAFRSETLLCIEAPRPISCSALIDEPEDQKMLGLMSTCSSSWFSFQKQIHDWKRPDINRARCEHMVASQGHCSSVAVPRNYWSYTGLWQDAWLLFHCPSALLHPPVGPFLASSLLIWQW